ncbi:hypothetical protein [Streptomyces phaeofaciens]|uniref:hypothetical protein n=1 Tax=Streptomyces phaeofaciens TaxID=68254 RepID=UPI00167BC198|nr:hypothetical protein [Streptomyces phaeofaciens]
MSGDRFGTYDHGFVMPPVPPMPSAPPPGPADGVRAVAVAVLNLSGLGLGYALARKWVLTVLCWAATAVLLFVALPADPDGVPGLALVLYALFLAAAAAHGARVGLRTRLAWPPQAPLALGLGLVLLAVPAGGFVLYDDARDEAVEQMLLDRLADADALVASAGKGSFTAGKSEYREALRIYEDLSDDHSGSRAAAKVPGRLRAYYESVGAPYAQDDYCAAIAPLTYLRTVPDTLDGTDLGDLESWPDDRLATSLYECAADGLTTGQATWTSQFGELLTGFPGSEQAAKVEPAVAAAVTRTQKELRGSDPCSAVERLNTLGSQIDGLPTEGADTADALGKQADRATGSADSGTYTCGVDQYRDGDFEAAQTTMKKYVADHKSAKNAALAKKIVIAAEIAETVPAAGKKLPTTRSGGSIEVTVQNDSPDAVTVMYTGPVTGSFSLKGCGSCKAYPLLSTTVRGFEPCSDSGKNYPQRTISLPPGTTYFLHKPQGDSTASPASDTAKLQSGYIYTECAYTTTSGLSGL